MSVIFPSGSTGMVTVSVSGDGLFEAVVSSRGVFLSGGYKQGNAETGNPFCSFGEALGDSGRMLCVQHRNEGDELILDGSKDGCSICRFVAVVAICDQHCWKARSMDGGACLHDYYNMTASWIATMTTCAKTASP